MRILFVFVLMQTFDPKLNSNSHNARYNFYLFIFWLQNLIWILICLENFVEEVAVSIEEVERKGKSCCEAETTASEDERRKVRVRSLKKRTKRKVIMNGGGGSGSCSGSRLSISLSQSLRKRGNKVADCRFASISINDVRDSKEEEAVNAFRQTLLAKDLLPPSHDDYHTLLRYNSLSLTIVFLLQYLLLLAQ